MALIKIDELRPASSEFSADTEGYMSDLTEGELTISGGFLPSLLSVLFDTAQVNGIGANISKSFNNNLNGNQVAVGSTAVQG